jgi:transcription termination factor Rho
MSGEGTEAQRRGGGRKRRPNHRGGNEGFEKGGPEDEAQEGAATEVPEAPSAPTQASAPRDHDRSENGSNGHGQERYEEGDGPGGRLNLKELKEKKISELTRMARDLAIEGAAGHAQAGADLRDAPGHAARNGTIYSEGVLECLSDGFGFLRSPDYNYLPGPDDIYVSPSQLRRFNLRTGDTVSGQIRPPKDNERYFALLKVESVNFEPPEVARDKILFDNLTPLYPQARNQPRVRNDNMSTRIIDLLCRSARASAR